MSAPGTFFQRRLITNSAIVTRYIVGYKKEESDFLLKFLYDHIALSQDLQTRIRWRPNTVVVWDVSFSLSWTEYSRSNSYRTEWRPTVPSLTGKMAKDAIWPGSRPRLKLRMRRRLRVNK